MIVTTLPCGCWIATSMFGDHEILELHPCDFHATLLQDQLKQMKQIIRDNPAPKEENE